MSEHEKAVTIVSAPFNIPVGGYLREYWVLPLIAKALYELGITTYVYIPATALLDVAKFAKSNSENGSDTTVVEFILKNIKDLNKRGSYTMKFTFIDTEKLMSIINERSSTIFFSRIAPKNLIKPLSAVSNILNEIRYVHSALLDTQKPKHTRNLLVYVTHETPEALYLGYKLRSLLGGVGAITFHHIEPYHFGYVYRQHRIVYSIGLKGIVEFFVSRIIKNLIKPLGIRLVNSITPEIVLYKKELNKLSKKILINVLNPPNALRKELINKNDYLRCRDENKIRFVYFGRISVEKGIFDLLDIWRKIQNKLKNAELVIIGMPSNASVAAYINRYVKARRLKRIRFLGIRPYEDIVKEALRSHILIYPSYVDGFSFTVLESIAMGLIIIAYDIPAITYHYRNVPSVIRVGVGNRDAMARVALKIARNYEEECENRIVKSKDAIISFLKKYYSWYNVAEAEIKGLLTVLNT